MLQLKHAERYIAGAIRTNRGENACKDSPKVLVDVAIDQGGNFPQARSTTYDEPVYRDAYGNLRFAVANLPSLCGPRASQAISETVLPYTRVLAKNPDQALRNGHLNLF